MNEKTFLQLKSGKLRELLIQAINKAGSERVLAKLIKISKSHVHALKQERRHLSNIYASRLLYFLELPADALKDNIITYLPTNWGMINGGRKVVQLKKMRGTFEKEMRTLKKLSSARMKLWHKHMREESPREYYTWQYKRFKKIDGGYKLKTYNGIFVRNKLEKEIADFLSSCQFIFEYEPYLNVDGKCYFPDFRVGNCIIEATEWKHPTKEKLCSLQIKLMKYKQAGFRVCFFIPLKYRNFYKELGNFVTSDLEQLKNFLSLHSSDA